jgi:hypothetical protein
MYFTVRAYRREPSVLKNLAINGDSIAVIEVRGERRAMFAQRAQQLAHVARFELNLGCAASKLL